MPRFPSTSASSASLSASVFSDLVRRAHARQAGGRKVYWLHVGDTYLEPLPAARAEAQRTEEHPRLHNYARVQGEPSLLAAIGRRLTARAGHEIDPAGLQVMSGATAGLTVVAASLLDPADEVLLPSPYWPLIRGILAGRGATPVEVPIMDKTRSSLDVGAALEERVTPRTAAIYLNTPHNPTGAVLPTAWVDAVAKVAVAHDLWVISDETYEELWFTEERPAPVWNRPDLRDRCVSAHTLSKSYGLAGARVGFCYGPAAAMRVIQASQTFATYCAPRPMQLGAVRALEEGDGWLAETRAGYAAAGARAARALGLPAPEGGTFLFFHGRPYFRPEEDILGFLTRCLDESGVLLTPGAASGEDYRDWARLCFTSVPPDELDEALDQLRKVLE